MPAACTHNGCSTMASWGAAGTRRPDFCSQHAAVGMVPIPKRYCNKDGCFKRCSYGKAGSKTPEFCSQHAAAGMVNVEKKRYCHNDGCSKRASHGIAGSKTPEFCVQHAAAGMVNVDKKRCGVDGCSKGATYGIASSKTAEFCFQHAATGTVNIDKKRYCNNDGCSRGASFGIVGSKTAEFCFQHAATGMVNVDRKRCGMDGCSKGASFGIAGSKTGEFCCQHARAGMVNVEKKPCVVDGCSKGATYGIVGSKRSEFCKAHAKAGMVCIGKKKCDFDGCLRLASWGAAGNRTAKFCAQHAEAGMVCVGKRKCMIDGCSTGVRYDVPVAVKGKFCKYHCSEEMAKLSDAGQVTKEAGAVTVGKKKCVIDGCVKGVGHDVVGAVKEKMKVCQQQCREEMTKASDAGQRTKEERMLVGGKKKCEIYGCPKGARYDVPGAVKGKFCKRHCTEHMAKASDGGQRIKVRNNATRNQTEGEVGNVVDGRGRKRSCPSSAQFGVASASGCSRDMLLSIRPGATSPPLDSELSAAGSDSAWGDVDADSKPPLDMSPRRKNGRWMGANPNLHFASQSEDISPRCNYSGSSGNGLGYWIWPPPEPVVTEITSHLSSSRVEFSRGGALMNDSALADADRGRAADDERGTMEIDGRPAMAAAAHSQSGNGTGSAAPITGEMSLINLAPLVVEACATEDEEMDDGMMLPLASAKKCAAANFASAAAVILELASEAEPVVTENMSHLSSSRVESSGSGASMKDSALADADRGSADDGKCGTMGIDRHPDMAATAHSQCGNGTGSAAPRTAKISLVNLASLVVKACTAEEEGVDEGMMLDVASTKTFAAANFASAAAVILELASEVE
ncbi:unnamed protein product [Sphacelaria rigidula]